MSAKSKGAAFLSLALAASFSQAGPYTGSGVACTPTATATNCKIELNDFMQSKFNWTSGVTYTSDSTNLAAAANSATTSSFRYIKQQGYLTYNYDTDSVTYASSDVNVKQGFMTHPRFPNVLMHSKTGSNTTEGGTLEMFRWASGTDNAMYVLSEPQWTTSGYNSYDQTDSAPNMQWRHRGYFWSDKAFDVTKNPANPSEWLAPVRSWSGSSYDAINSSGAKVGNTWVGNANSVQVKYYPSENGSWINQGGGALPTTPMEVLEVVLRAHDPANGGAIYWWEKYAYARQKLTDGTYNSFGMIRFQSSLDYRGSPSKLKCTNGVPPLAKPNAKCGDLDFIIGSDAHYNAFHNANDAAQGTTIKQWYDTALLPAYKFKNDVKLTKRTAAEDVTLPHVRGGFIPPGSGNDAKGVYFGGSSSAPPGEMLYLENTTVEQDWYVYPNGKDPLFAPAASPTNYCREGYNYLASFPVTKSYNGLNGTVEDTGALHWIIVCGTSTDGYFHGSNGGAEQSCNTGYVTRGWFAKPSSLSMTTCVPGGACTDATAKAYINFCVSQNETDFTYPAPNP